MYYKVIMETGHMGAGKSLEMVGYFQGDDIISMFDKIHKFPKVKKKERRRGVVLIRRISRSEYKEGLHNT